MSSHKKRGPLISDYHPGMYGTSSDGMSGAFDCRKNCHLFNECSGALIAPHGISRLINKGGKKRFLIASAFFAKLVGL